MSTPMATIALILRALSGATAVREVFQARPDKLRIVLDTLASLAELPGETELARTTLLEQVHRWVSERREPTDAELNSLTELRLDLDRRIREARDRIPG